MIKLFKNYLNKLNQLGRMNESSKTNRKKDCNPEKLKRHDNERRNLGKSRLIKNKW